MDKKNKKVLILGIIGVFVSLIIVITIFGIINYNYGEQTYSVEKISFKIPKKWRHIHDKKYGEYFYPFKDSTNGMLYVATTNIDDVDDAIIDDYFDEYISGIKEGYTGDFKIIKKEKIKVLNYKGIKMNFYCTISDEKYEQQLYAFIDIDNGILYSFLNSYKNDISKSGEKELKRVIDSIQNKKLVERDDIDNTICNFEYNKKDEDGMTSRINYNAFFKKNKKVYEESLTEYVFENNDLAQEYYQEHIKELKEYGNEVHLIDNIMKIFNSKDSSNKEAASSVSLYKTLEYKCTINNNLMIKKYNKEKTKFKKEKEKSDIYIKNITKSTDNKSKEETTQKTDVPESNYNNTSSGSEYMDALRKCSVMEAADIYTTGIGKKSDNIFNDGKETCESWYKQWGEKDFLEAVNVDWTNRQNEEIDGKSLSYYLDILGW